MKHRNPVTPRFLRSAAALILAAFCGAGHAQGLPRVDVMFQEKPLRIDGRLNDTAWTTAVPMPLGTVDGQPIPNGAVAKLAWDRDYLYMGVEIPDDLLIAGQTRRDGLVWERDDVLELFLWPDDTQPYYYQIAVNPRGTFFDGFFIANANRNGAVFSLPDWNPEIRAQARLHPASVYRPDRPGPATAGGFWNIEVAVPLAALSSRGTGLPAPGETWRAQIVRFNRPDPRPGELEASAWSPYQSVTEPYLLDRFGTIVFQGGPAPVIPPLVPGTGVSTQPVVPPPAPVAVAVPVTPVAPPPTVVEPTPVAEPVTPPTPVVEPVAPPTPPVTPPAEPVTPPAPVVNDPPAPVTPPSTTPGANVTLNFNETPTADALNMLFKGTGKTYTITPAALRAAPTVTVLIQDLPFDQALTALLQVASVQHRTDLAFTMRPTGAYAVDLRNAPAPPSVPPGQG